MATDQKVGATRKNSPFVKQDIVSSGWSQPVSLLVVTPFPEGRPAYCPEACSVWRIAETPARRHGDRGILLGHEQPPIATGKEEAERPRGRALEGAIFGFETDTDFK